MVPVNIRAKAPFWPKALPLCPAAFCLEVVPTYPPSPELWRGRVLLVHEGTLSKGPDFPGSLLLLGLASVAQHNVFDVHPCY